ncbi:MAG TPA: glycosyltransferase family 39 protein [Kofleriaceae bacterium]
MSRNLRILLLGSIAIAFLYLLVHSREPLRLNIGDPWSDANVLSSINYVKSDGFLATSFTDILDVGPLTEDSYRYIHYPPLAEIFYGAVGKYLGVSDIATYRLFALTFSSLALWLLFSYVRRLYSDRVALVATGLFGTSFFWLMYADSIHQAPVMQCTGFLALWGLIRAIETGLRRHYAAAILGSFACFFTSYDYMLFLPVAVLFTLWVKRGNPFARGNRHFVALCAAGCAMGIVVKCLCVIGAVGWTEFVADLRLQFLERATSTHDRHFTSAIPTMIRRITLVFTPLAWITFAYHVIKAVRAQSLVAALKDTALWMLFPALAFLYVFAQLAASQMLASQVLLPVYAIGSALIIDRMFEGRALMKRLAYAWIVVAVVWSFFFMFTHPRSVLDRDDVAKTNAYLAANDHNDFVMSNVMSDGHIQASFERHYWAALDADDTTVAPLQMMRVFELTGSDYVHEIIFHDVDSRFIDKSLWPLALRRQWWSVTGWPHLYRKKTNSVIAEYDKRVQANLKAVRATKVLALNNYSVYRVDRATVLGILAERIPVVTHIDFKSLTSHRHVIMGWSNPYLMKDTRIPVTSIGGFGRCPVAKTDPKANACKTILTKFGLKMKYEEIIPTGQLHVRLERSCDLQLTIQLALPGAMRIEMNGFTATPPPGFVAAVTVPARSVKPGMNIIELRNLFPMEMQTWLHLSAMELTQSCSK